MQFPGVIFLYGAPSTYQSTMIIQAHGPVALKTSAIYAVHRRISISHTLSVPRSMLQNTASSHETKKEPMFFFGDLP